MRAALKKSRPLLEWGCRLIRSGRSKLFRRQFVQLGRPCLSPNSAAPNRIVITLSSVVLPLQRLEISQFITATFGNGSNMINLPRKLGLSVSVIFPFYQSIADIPAILGRISSSNDFTLSPNSHSSLESEMISATVAVSIPYCFHKNYSLFQSMPWGFPQSFFWNQGKSLGYCSANYCLIS